MKLLLQQTGAAARGALDALIVVYQKTASPVLAAMGAQCRFTPTCSQYARDALAQLPLHRALAAIVWRLLRCQPLCRGGEDPVRAPRKEIARGEKA